MASRGWRVTDPDGIRWLICDVVYRAVEDARAPALSPRTLRRLELRVERERPAARERVRELSELYGDEPHATIGRAKLRRAEEYEKLIERLKTRFELGVERNAAKASACAWLLSRKACAWLDYAGVDQRRLALESGWQEDARIVLRYGLGTAEERRVIMEGLKRFHGE